MALRNDIDPDGLLEYSVVFTDRSLNHMSLAFQQVMREIHATLCEVYGADRTVIVPGVDMGSGCSDNQYSQFNVNAFAGPVQGAFDPQLYGEFAIDP